MTLGLFWFACHAICCREVMFIAQFARRRRLDHVIAVSLCALMLFFAVGSKLAWYHSKEVGARSIAATKVWKAKSVAVDSASPGSNVPLQTAVQLIFLLSLCLVWVEPSRKSEEPVFHPPLESFAALAMRPPPAR